MCNHSKWWLWLRLWWTRIPGVALVVVAAEMLVAMCMAKDTPWQQLKQGK